MSGRRLVMPRLYLQRNGLAVETARRLVAEQVGLDVVSTDENAHSRVSRHQFRLDGRDQCTDLQRGGARIAAYGLGTACDQLRLGIGNGQPHDRTGLEQPGDMLVQAKDRCASPRLMHTHVVKGQRATLQALRENVNRRVAPGYKIPVPPHHAVDRTHGPGTPYKGRTRHNRRLESGVRTCLVNAKAPIPAEFA